MSEQSYQGSALCLPSMPHRRLLPILAVFITGLTMVAILIGSRFATPHLSIRADDLVADRFLVRFHQAEHNGVDSYRWSQAESVLFLYGFNGRPAILDLRLISPRPVGAPAAVVTLHNQERSLGPFTVSHNWRRYRLLIPTHRIGDTSLVLQSTAFQPGSDDTRELGVALSQLEARPLWGAGMPLAPIRFVFLSMLPLFSCLLLRHRPLLALGAGVGLAVVAGWASAMPLASGYLLPTIWPEWWQLALITGMLCAPTGLERLRACPPSMLWIGVGLMLIGVLALRLGSSLALAVPLLLLGALLALAVLGNCKAEARSCSLSRVESLLLVGMALLSLGLRLYHLDTLPLGLWRDEARHGLLALRIWQDPSFRPVYVVFGADLPALLFYLISPVVGLAGPHVWSVRLVSALAGGLAPLALWWAVRPFVAARVAFVAATLLAGASWSLSMSRWAFPSTLDQLMSLLAIGLAGRALDGVFSGIRMRQVLLLSLAALCAGLSVYTYHTGRITPFILATLVCIRLGRSWAAWRRAAPALISALLVGLLILMPLLRFVAADFVGFNRRTNQVALLNSIDPDVHSPLALLLRNAERQLLMWHVRGDPNGRHHAPDVPLIDPICGVLLLLGLGLALVQRKRSEMQTLLLWLAIALIPGLLSTNAPHAMRSFGALAPACVLMGLGLEALLRQISDSRKHGRLAVYGCLSVLMGSLAFNGALYFGQMAREPAVYRAFDLADTAMARLVRASNETSDPALQAVRVFIPSEMRSSEVVAFLTNQHQVEFFDGVRLSAAPGPQALVLLPPDASPQRRGAALAALGPGAAPMMEVPLEPGDDTPLFLAYSVGSDAARLIREAFPQDIEQHTR